MSDEILSEIGRFDNEYHPDAGMRPGIDTLPDGDYEFEIASVDLGRTAKSMDAILRLGLQVVGGPLVERPYFFATQTQTNRCGADMAALGFVEFLQGGAFSTKLKAALPRLKGVRFRGRKVTEEGKDSAGKVKVYHNLYVAGRIGASTSNRAAPPPSAVAQAPIMANHVASPPPSEDESSIPF